MIIRINQNIKKVDFIADEEFEGELKQRGYIRKLPLVFLIHQDF